MGSWWKILGRGSALLAISALGSKLLSFGRDRLVLDTFSTAEADLVFAAFRIPDFFFYLLVGATLSVIFIPRLVDLERDEQADYLGSFLSLVGVGFGVICLTGAIFSPWLASVVFPGFTPDLQLQIATLARYLFVSVFLLSLSSVLAANLQAQERFLAIALAPLLYMGTMVGVLYAGGNQSGLLVVGYGAISGAVLHLILTLIANLWLGTKLRWAWLSPKTAWKNFAGDFGRRVLNNAAFQINQTIDLLIASLLLMGSVTAFTLGTNLGHFLLSILGMAVANVIFPKLAKVKHQAAAQIKLLRHASLLILAGAIPFSLLVAWGGETILKLLFDLSGDRLAMTKTVLFWTVISLPFACLIPLFSRYFLANDDTYTPLWINFGSLTIATGLAAYLSLIVFPPEIAILGLALGTFTANTLSCFLFATAIWYHHRRT